MERKEGRIYTFPLNSPSSLRGEDQDIVLDLDTPLKCILCPSTPRVSGVDNSHLYSRRTDITSTRDLDRGYIGWSNYVYAAVLKISVERKVRPLIVSEAFVLPLSSRRRGRVEVEDSK
jgi:hypothetical protein